MVLFDDVVHVLALTKIDVHPGVVLDALDGSRVGAALVDGDFLGHAVPTDGLLQETTCSSAVSVGQPVAAPDGVQSSSIFRLLIG